MRVRRGKGLKSTDWQLQSSYGVIKYSKDSIVENIVITMSDVGGSSFFGVITLLTNVLSLCCIPDINIILM